MIDGRASTARPSIVRPSAAGIPLIEVGSVTKTFGAVQALRAVDLNVRAGEVHGLVGANGAGKSTLIRILAGVIRPDSGTIRVDGEEMKIRDPHHASTLGLAFLHQELNLIPKFSVLDNMCLGLVSRGRLGLANRAPAFREARKVAAEIGFDSSLKTPVGDLTVAQQWLVALGRSLMRRARLVALDEPTGSFSARETERLFEIIKEMTAEGRAVLYVSHRLEEVDAICHRVTTFRDGQVVETLERDHITTTRLIQAITGGEEDAMSVRAGSVRAGARVAFEARGLRRKNTVDTVSLALREGEIVGLAGLVGSGRTELARLLFGADRCEAGELFLDGRPVSISSPAVAIRLGIGFVPEERRSEALFLDKNATFNLNIASSGALRMARGLGLISTRRGDRRASEVADRVDLRPRDVHILGRNFSGGNQQKLVIGRWLLGGQRILILDEPTKGVDVGARAQIHRLLRDLADAGTALLLISSDFAELLHCDRVLVLARGRIVKELTGSEITEDQMLLATYEDRTAGDAVETADA